MGLSKLTLWEPKFEARLEVEVKSVWSDCRSFKHEVLTRKAEGEANHSVCADYKIHCRAFYHWITLGGRGEYTSRVVLPREDSLGNYPPLSSHWLEYASEGMNFPVLQACLSRAKRKPQGNNWLLLAEGHHDRGTNTICRISLMGNKLTS